MMLPRHLEIIYEINGRLLATVRERFPGDEDRVGTRQLDRRKAHEARPHGEPGYRRLAQHEWRRGHSLQAAAQR